MDIPVFDPFARVGGGLLTLFKKYGDVENVCVCSVGEMVAAQVDLVRAIVFGRVRKWKSDIARGATDVGRRKEDRVANTIEGRCRATK